MRSPRDYLIVSTTAGLFSSAAILRAGVDVQLWYGVMAINLFLLAWLGRLSVRRGILLLAGGLLASGAAGVAQGTDTVALFAKQFGGILVSAIYFSSFFALVQDDPAEVFRHYVRGAYWISILGITIVAVEAVATGEFPRLHSILSEPAMFSIVTVPAIAYCLDRYAAERLYGKELVVMLGALVLSQSSVGFIGVMISLAVVFGRSFARLLGAAAAVCGLGAICYQASAAFQVRVDDTVRAAQEMTVENANLSTFALLSNAFVTGEVLKAHPIAGNGVGSHALSHAKYVSDVPGMAMFENMILSDTTMMDQLNASDANSLLLRLLSETGFLGVAAIAVFLWRYKAPGRGALGGINAAAFVYIALKLLRAGHYFSPEQFFFFFAYALSGRTAARPSLTERAHTTEALA